MRSYRTVSPLPRLDGRAVCFLLHLPSRHRDSTLWSTLPCSVRTFLQPRQRRDQRSPDLLRPLFALFLLPIYDPLAVGAMTDFIEALQFIEKLRRNVHVASRADGLLDWNNRQTPNFFTHVF